MKTYLVTMKDGSHSPIDVKTWVPRLNGSQPYAIGLAEFRDGRKCAVFFDADMRVHDNPGVRATHVTEVPF